MIQINCDKCGKRYRVDESKIPGEKAKFRCKSCDNFIYVTRSQPEGETLSAERTSQPPFPASTTELQREAFRGSGEWGERDLRPKHDVLADSRPPTRPEEKKDVTKKRSVRSKKARFGLTAKVVTLMLIISLVPLATFWTIQFKQINDRLRTDTVTLMDEIATGLTNHVDQWIDKNLRVLQAAAQMPDIISMDKRKQEPILKAIQSAYPWMYLVFTVGPDGMNVARNDDKPLKDYSDRQYYRDVIGGKDISWQTLIGKTSKLPALVMAVPVKSGDKIIGVMANAMTVEDISQKIANWRQGNTGFAFLVDEKSKVVAHHIKEYYLKQKNLSQQPLISAFNGGLNGSLYYTDERGRQCIGYVKGTKYRWALAVQQDEQEAFNTLRKMQYFTYVLLGITIAVVLLVAWFSARSIARPIGELTEAADRMSLGDLNVQIKTKSRDEIGQLSEAISRMQDSLRLSLERLRRRK